MAVLALPKGRRRAMAPSVPRRPARLYPRALSLPKTALGPFATHRSQVSTSSRSWTHAPQKDGACILVVVSDYGDDVTGVTYGGLALSRVLARTIYSRRHEVWFRGDIVGRASDIVAVAGLGATNAYMSSTILATRRPVSVATSEQPGGWAGWSAPNTYLSSALNDTIAGQAWRAMVSVASGEGSFSAGGLLPSPAAKGSVLSFANTASNNGVAVVLHGPFGPDELATVAGFLATVADPGARFRSHTLLQWGA
jgi:hypothetical protein